MSRTAKPFGRKFAPGGLQQGNLYTHSKLYFYIKPRIDNRLKVSVLPTGFQIKFEGVKRAIAFRDTQWEIMSQIQQSARAKIEATMKAYCEHGPQNIPPQRFKFEIQYEQAGKKTRIEVFKARHVRIYGACGSLGGRPVFLVTGTDTSKKSDAADQKKLRSAGKLAHKLIHESNGATLK